MNNELENNKTIILVLDNKLIEEYNNAYFKIHPKAKKKPIDKPWHPSINQWMILPRIQMNGLKQRWKEFCIWWINKLGYQNMKLDNFEVVQTTYFDTRRRHDIDNYCPKFINDGWTDAGFILDDDANHFKCLTMKCDYDKSNPRMEFVFKILN